MEEEEEGFTINQEFAKKYSEKKRREELSKLREKYGEDYEPSSSSSEEEDEYAEALTPETQMDFFRTLSLVRAKDPRIYNKGLSFFRDPSDDDEEETGDVENEDEQKEEEEEEGDGSAGPKKKRRKKKAPAPPPEPKEKPVYLRDYERKLLLEHGSEAFVMDSDSDAERRAVRMNTGDKSYVEEQQGLKEDVLRAAETDDEDEDGGDFLTLRKKEKKEEKLEESYREWLRGGNAEVAKNEKTDLEPLRRYWNDPELNEDERFLRDYILNKGYMDKEVDEIPTYHELMGDESEDEQEVATQERFERKYNFRYEEPDAEFIKTYPRTMSTVRAADTVRRDKRKAREERKEKEKEERDAELRRLKKLKKREIKEKLSKIEEITGIGVDVDKIDLDGDFDASKYDEAMEKAFGSDFYAVEETEKPTFSDMEGDSGDDIGDEDAEEVASGSYGDYTVVEAEDGEASQHYNKYDNGGEGEEEEEFNMDADFDASAAGGKSKKQLKKERQRRRRAGAEVDALPTFDRDEKSLQDYLDEYFKLDYEDTVGDTKCRFKYRDVLPNSFGLSTEEVLTCEDRELNSWVSLKKAVQYRTPDEETADVKKYKKRAREGKRKRRILVSTYEQDGEDGSSGPPQMGAKPFKVRATKRKHRPEGSATSHAIRGDQSQTGSAKKTNNRRSKPSPADSVAPGRQALFGIDPNRSKHKKKNQKKNKGKPSS